MEAKESYSLLERSVKASADIPDELINKLFSTPGKFVVSYSALVQNRPSYFFIEAIVDSDILQFSYSRWMDLVNEDIRWYPFPM